MALTPEDQTIEALGILTNTITNNIYHKHYKHVVEYAKKMNILITGDNMKELLRKFSRREDDVQFAQRVELTNAITPAVAASLMTPFYKVGRSNNIIKSITFESNDNSGTKLEDIKDAELHYNGDKSLHRYLETRLVELNFSDPNSFIVTEFDMPEVGAMGELLNKVEPRPFEVSSHEAINYFYKNNILQWLVIKDNCNYYDFNDNVKKGEVFTIYYPDIAIKFTQIDLTSEGIAIGQLISYSTPDGVVQYYRSDKQRFFQVENFTYNAGYVPAVRVGYKPDLSTDGVTMVSPMHDALCYFMKSIKTVSEFDLTMALHAFPQKFQYVQRCLGVNNLGCNNGQTTDGGTCSKCSGSGFAIHTSAQDGVVMRIPKDKQDIIDLQQLVHYESPPIDLLKFQDEFIFQLKNEARQAVFNSEIFTKSDITKTATELTLSMEAVYDTLFPFAENFSKVYKDILYIIARFVDVTDIIIEHRFPKDFKFKTTGELLNELKIANESGAPGYVRTELSMDIAAQQYVDKPLELKRIESKQRYYPFPDKTQTEIAFIISSDLTTKYNKILYANFDNIFLELEKDAQRLSLSFYAYPPEKQKLLLDEKVNAMIAEIAGGETLAIGFNDPNAAEMEGVTDVEAEAKAKLKGSVGGVQGILALQDSVSRGITDINAAKVLLFEIYGFDEKTATRMLGTPKKVVAAPAPAPFVAK